MASLYSEYLSEKQHVSIIEWETGFATYKYLDPTTVYIIDVYVIPQRRKSGVAAGIADEVVREAKLKGCNKLVGTVVPSIKGSTDSLKVLLGYGMTLQSASPDLIVFEKEI